MKLLKKGLIFALLLSVALVLTFAGSAEAKKKWKYPPLLIAASGGTSSPGYIVPIAWTPEHEKDQGTTWRVLGEPATLTRIRWLQGNVIHFWYTDLETGDDIIHGDEGLITRDTGPMQIRVALPGFLQAFGPWSFGESGLKTIEDIRKNGARWGVPIGSSGIVKFFKAFRAYLGLDEKKLIQVDYGNWPGMFRAMAQGKIDILMDSPTGPFVRRYAGTDKKGGISYFDWDENDPGFKKFREICPTTSIAPATLGVDEGRGKRMLSIEWMALSNANEDQELVYRLVKWHADNFDKFKDKCIECGLITMESFRKLLDMTYVPVHEGAIRYMKEIGKWTEADDQRQEYNIKILNKYIEAYKMALERADDQRVKVMPKKEKWVKVWEDYKTEIKIPEVRIMSNKEIAEELPKL